MADLIQDSIRIRIVTPHSIRYLIRTQTADSQVPNEWRKLPDSGGRPSCRHGRRKLPDPGCGQSCCHGQRKLPAGQSCCHEQRKLPDPGDRQSCCHGQRELPGRQSCCHEQRKLPNPEDIRQEADKVSATNCGDGEPSISSTSASNSKAGVPNMSSSYDHDWFEQRPEQPVRLLSPRAFIQKLEGNRTQFERSEDSTQPDESPSTRRSPKTRSSGYSTRYQHQPMKIQPNPDRSNSRLPVRLDSLKKSPHRWTQQRKASPNSTPSVSVKTQPDRPVKVKFDVGDVTNELPASAVGLRAERVLVDSTGSNPENHVGPPPVSPVVRLMRPYADGISASISQAGEPSFRRIRADIEMSASNYHGRPDDDDILFK